MARYKFLVIENEDVMEVPGEIEEIITSRPHSKEQFAALVRLPEGESGNDGNDQSGDSEDDSERVMLDTEFYGAINGVGGNTAENLLADGYTTISDLEAATTDDLEEVNGVGPSTAENIKNYVK